MTSLHILTRHNWEETKVTLYSFFGARGIGTNGARARVLKQNLYFHNKKEGFLIDLKTHIGRVQDDEFFDNWHMDRPFLSLAVKKISSNFTHKLM